MQQSRTITQSKSTDSQHGASGNNASRSMPAVPVIQKTAPDEELLQKKPNNTGLPDNLKSGIENLSGYSMDDVKVHYNSSKPAQLQALAFAQGTDIHVVPGQEQHLPHEAWHVVQQKQGRVQPTMQMKEGVAVNDDKELESEADVMGKKAVQMKLEENKNRAVANSVTQEKRKMKQAFWFVENRDKPVSQKYFSSHNPLFSIQRVSKSNFTNSSFSNNVVQLTQADALKYAKKIMLVDAKKINITKVEVIALLKKTELALPQKEELRSAWNKDNLKVNCILASDAGYDKELQIAQAETLARLQASEPVAGLDELDSDDDGEMNHKLVVQNVLRQATPVNVVTQKNVTSPAYLLQPPLGLKVLHLIKKFKLFDDFASIQIIFKMGNFWQLYTAPRNNDFAYAPLLYIDDNHFQRDGGVDSWHTIAQILKEEMQAADGMTFRDQINRIVLTFQGKGGPLTKGESHAIGAIICDFAAGIEGAKHYLDILWKSVGNGSVTTHAQVWDGESPDYQPAKVEGRGLMAVHRQSIAPHLELFSKAKEFLQGDEVFFAQHLQSAREVHHYAYGYSISTANFSLNAYGEVLENILPRIQEIETAFANRREVALWYITRLDEVEVTTPKKTSLKAELQKKADKYLNHITPVILRDMSGCIEKKFHGIAQEYK